LSGIPLVNLRRNFRQFALSLFFVVLAPSAAHAHGSLISSVPANKSVTAKSPSQVHLVFSEPIESSMSRLILVTAEGSRALTAIQDPRNVNALVAGLDSLGDGNYELRWQILSADGHAVSGTIQFGVGDTSARHPSAIVAAEPDMHESGMEMAAHTASTRLGMFFRGFGMTALMALSGLLLFASRAETGSARNHSRLIATLAALASACFIIHLFLWCWQASSGLGDFDLAEILATSAGRRECIRTLLALLALWAWWLARRPALTLLFALAGVLSGAFIGHAAATAPVISISFKAIHLLAGSVWLGGLAWILLLERDRSSFRDETEKVSQAAVWCALVIVVTGIVQAGIILSWRTAALTSPYALVAALKLFGSAVLIAMGAVNRFRMLPALDMAFSQRNLQRIVRHEIRIMVVVAMLGGVLSYLSPPELSRQSSAETTK
jgi:copper transport protein